MTNGLEFRLLGPLEVLEHQAVLALGGGRQRCLFAVLLLRANEPVSSDRLIDALWPGRAPPTAAKTIQVYVSRLRKELGEGRLVTRAPGYLLRVDPGELDLDRFERLLGEARTDEPETAARKLREALALWRGPALGDLAYEPFAQPEIARLEELRLVALEQRIEADLACGRHRELIGELEALVFEHPLRERLRCHLMVALYRSGAPGRGARGLPRCPPRALGGARPRARRGAEAARAGDPAPGPAPRPAGGHAGPGGSEARRRT